MVVNQLTVICVKQKYSYSHLELCSVLLTEGRCIYSGCTCNIKSAADLHHHLTTDVIAHNLMCEQITRQLALHVKAREKIEQGLEMQVINLQQHVTALMNIILPLL